MKEPKQYELDFEQYIRNVEPSKKDKTYAWATAIGLQQVDGLTPSKYLYETAKQNIDGKISIAKAKSNIENYYEIKSTHPKQNIDKRTEEADKVASRIAQILSEKSFNFSPSYLISIHKRLFENIFEFAGKIRDYDISKKEWILDNESVIYGASFELKSALDYDFEQERKFSYKKLSMEEIVKHITFFVSRLWQIHPFGECNTRTTAVFIIKYLRNLGFKADNDIFAKNSWYFRNALVRANYTNLKKGIEENSQYLEKFFKNLLLDENNELKNRYLHVRYKSLPINNKNLSINLPINKTQLQILKLLIENSKYTYDDIATKISKTRETVRANLRILESKNIIERVGSRKTGSWKIKKI